LALTPIYSPTYFFDGGGFCAGGDRPWMCWGRLLFLWALPRHDAGPDEVMSLANHLGVALPAELHWDRKALPLERWRERCAGERARARGDLEAWHRQQADLCEREEDWFASQFHLERL